MTGWLLDTDVSSELRRPKPDRKVAAFIVSRHHGLTVVSRDAGGFARTGVTLLDPWQPLTP